MMGVRGMESLMVLELQQIDGLAQELAGLHPADIIKRAQQEYGPELAVSFSGAEDVVLIDMASRTGLPFRVFTLDTGRLPEETTPPDALRALALPPLAGQTT